MQGDIDKVFLLDGLEHGFNLIDDNPVTFPAECDNYLSATDVSVKTKVELQIRDEILNGRYQVSEKRPVLISALGAIPKPNKTEVRLIHDCSRPLGHSLNDMASKNPVKYQTLDEAVNLSTPNCFYAKVDLKNAYRSVRIHPSNYGITGLKWHFSDAPHPTYMFDKRLPFGARKSPAIFHRLTQAVRRIMESKGFGNIIVYLDDFLIVAQTRDECRLAMNTLITLLRELGFAINWSKVEDPNTRVIFLGVELDSTNLTMSLPEGKLTELFNIIEEFKSKKRASKKQLQSLAGRMNWACRVIRGGRVYLRRVLNCMNQLNLSHHKIRLDKSFKADLEWWHCWMTTFNGTCMFRKEIKGQVFVDACTSGAGVAYNGDWAYVAWEADWPEVANFHINFKEVLAVVVAARRWAAHWANSRVIIHTDSECARHILTKGSTRNEHIMPYIRELFWLAVSYNFEIDYYHIPGKINTLADTISRLHENGRWFQLEALLRQSGTFLKPQFIKFHMSAKSISYLIFQIKRWLELKMSWTETLTSIGLSHLPLQPNGHMPPIGNHIIPSAQTWDTSQSR